VGLGAFFAHVAFTIAVVATQDSLIRAVSLAVTNLVTIEATAAVTGLRGVRAIGLVVPGWFVSKRSEEKGWQCILRRSTIVTSSVAAAALHLVDGHFGSMALNKLHKAAALARGNLDALLEEALINFCTHSLGASIAPLALN